MKNSFVFIGFAMVTFLLGCKEDPIPYCEEFPENCAQIQDVKNWFYFKPGSYWVYEEESSGEVDCVYVVDSYSDPASYYFTTETKSSRDGYTYEYWSSSGAKDLGNVRKDENSVLVKCSKHKPGDFVSESYCFIYYPFVGNWVYSSSGGAPDYYDNRLMVV